MAGCSVVALPDALAGFVASDAVVGYGVVLDGADPLPSPRRDADAGVGVGGDLVQFSSGSTRTPVGVVLTHAQIGANVDAILRRLRPGPGDVSYSWLPLSHDMGLVGMLLTAWAAGAPRWAGGGTIALGAPEQFLADPLDWAREMERVGATITAAPNFALERLAQRIDRGSFTLDRLRVCITGAERIRPETVERFTSAMAAAGVAPNVLCPAYGLAEATVAVTMAEPGAPCRAVAVDGGAVVASGAPLDGIVVRIDDPDPATGIGRVLVSSPAVTGALLGAELPVVDGWLRTDDLGGIIDGSLVVVARSDEVIKVGGRKLHLPDIDACAGAVAGVRAGAAVAVAHGSGDGYDVVLEPDVGADAGGLPRAVRVALAQQLGVGPGAVAVIDRGALPKTTSGKPRRAAAGCVAGLQMS